MFRAHAVGTAETYCAHAGPKTVESMTSEDGSRGEGGVHRRWPVGGYGFLISKEGAQVYWGGG